MLVQIASSDDGSSMRNKLLVYKCYNVPQKLFEETPYSEIEDEVFRELITSAEEEKLDTGETCFNVGLEDLAKLSIRLFPR